MITRSPFSVRNDGGEDLDATAHAGRRARSSGHVDERHDHALRAGRWDGNTLVVETTNFNDKGWIATNAASARIRGVPHSDALRLVERFARVDADTMTYEVTIEDPNVYTRPWTVAIPLSRDDSYQMFEYACHEGNKAVEHVLGAARAAERRAAEGTKQK